MDLLSLSQQRAQFWLKQQTVSEVDRNEIARLIQEAQKGKEAPLLEAFCKELEFGTAGLRGIVGVGPNKLNVYNARKAAQALALGLKEVYPAPHSVLLSYDSRLSSRDLLLACIEVLEANGISCQAFHEPTPTPLLSFAIRKQKATGGIMLTASHNPQDYNGIKVYGADGAQVTEPLDGIIMKHYQRITEDWTLIQRRQLAWSDVPTISQEVEEAYLACIGSEILQKSLVEKQGPQLKFVYTPLHGTGARIFEPLMKRLNFTGHHIVNSQRLPDGHFPTAPKPNPEEPAALKLASELMLQTQSVMAIGNDPDADRMGIVVNDDGKPVFLSGNEINNLMLHYKLDQLSKLGSLPSCGVVLKSIVSSPLQDKIAKHYGVKIYSTLTGFKWMAKKLKELEESKEPFSFLFASEESFGSMSHHHVRDKDGLSSAALFAELTLWHQSQGHSLVEATKQIYDQFGYHYDQVFSYTLPGIAGMGSIQKLMEHARQKASYDSWFKSQASVTELTDFFRDTSTGLPTGIAAANLIKYSFADSTELYLRPSGTEPKIKFYIMLQGDGAKQKSLEWKKTIDQLVEAYL